MTKVKICGNTNTNDVNLAIQLGADFIGFIFVKSKRQVTVESVKSIIRSVPPFSNYVGVFVNQPKAEVEKIAAAAKLKWLQFHGEETSRYCQYFSGKGFSVIKTFHIKDSLSLKRIDEYDVDAFLFDTFSSGGSGGTGKVFDWTLIHEKPYVHDKLFLAGGLSVDNIQNAIQKIRPYAVDVASGVEKSPGIKDPQLLEEFIRLAQGKTKTGKVYSL